MVKSILACAAAALALAAPALYAQQDKPGEDRAVTSKPATAQEKQDAKMKRKAAGKDVSAKDEGRLDDKPAAAGPTTKVSDEEKALGKAKRKSAGAAAAKEGSGRLEDEGGSSKK
jgi:hypothetical protein